MLRKMQSKFSKSHQTDVCFRNALNSGVYLSLLC